MLEVQCQNCHLIFRAYKARGEPRKYCSRECKDSSTDVFKTCVYCNETFKTKIGLTRLYCSQKCSNTKNHKQRSLDSLRKTFKCKECSCEFHILESKVKVREKFCKITFCSVECFHKSIQRVIPCCWCKMDFKPQRLSTRFCSLDCKNEWTKDRTKENPGSWLENGYKVIYTEDGKGIKEHIKIMQDFIGRKLEKDECVHHINEVKTDNRLENLLLMKKSDHSKLHRELEKSRGKKLFKKKQVEDLYPITIECVK
jgi:signal recognition particle subunit SEC65